MGNAAPTAPVTDGVNTKKRSLESLDDDQQHKITRVVLAEYEEQKKKNPEMTADELSAFVLDRVNAHGGGIEVSGASVGPVPGEYQVPKVRFGKTELMMPIVTCGGMRLQMSWNRGSDAVKIENMDQVDAECQQNLIAIIRRALAQGINHFETAQGYGCSEIQFCAALGELIESGEVKREDFILQTKVSPRKTAAEWKEALDKSLARLNIPDGPLGYVDLLSFHGINRDYQLDWIANNGENGNLIDVLTEYKEKGIVRHVGFSTHGQAPCILKAVESNLFEYANIHYDYIGSYTASGSGPAGGNGDVIAAMAERDMGVFIISPYDKGGKLYAPSIKFVELCSPDLDPIAFNSLWLWHHAPAAHTLVVGAARPSDFDQAVAASKLFNTQEGRDKTMAVAQRLSQASIDALGFDVSSAGDHAWALGLPTCFDTPTGIFVTHLVWLRHITKAWGMLEYARDRYGNLAGNLKDWDDEKTFEENTQGWGFVPGCPHRPALAEVEATLTADLERLQCPTPAADVITYLKEAHAWLDKETGAAPDDIAEIGRRAYNLQPSLPWPERKK